MGAATARLERVLEAQQLVVAALRFCDRHGLADIARPLDTARNLAAAMLRDAGREDLIDPVEPPSY